MSHYMKLVNFEVNRFIKMFIVLSALTIVTQLIGVIVTAKGFMQRAETTMLQQRLTIEQYVAEYSHYSFELFIYSPWFGIPILVCATVIALYIFFIWYRDWFGKSTFIYRLLMLPTARINVYFAKLTTILIFTFGFIALQIVLLSVEKSITQSIMNPALLKNESLFEIYLVDILYLLYPVHFVEFLVIYLVGMVFVTVIFTAILFERSFQWKGILLGVAYMIGAVALLIVPFIIQGIFTNVLYAGEFLLVESIIVVLIFTSAVWLAKYLLNHKITV